MRFKSVLLACRYVHQQDWDAAQKVAETYAPESVSDVLVGQVGLSHTHAHVYTLSPSFSFLSSFSAFLEYTFMPFSFRLE